MERLKDGFLNANELSEANLFTMGRKEKSWLTDGKNKYLFKTNASFSEIYAEVIAAELAKQCGFKTAEYDFATYNKKQGVITKSFLKKGDLIIGGKKYLEFAENIIKENNLNISMKENSIENIMNAVSFQDGGADTIQIMNDLLNMWIFDLLIMESDRNKTNWSIIRTIDNEVSIAPIYDYSTMCRMNTNIESLMQNLKSKDQIFNITDSIQMSLTIYNSSSENFYKEFTNFCEKFSEQSERIMSQIQNINVIKAIEDIEQRINSEIQANTFEIPYYVKTWLNLAINSRKQEMEVIFKNIKRKRDLNVYGK